MSQQESNYNQSTPDQGNAINPMDLFFDEEWLRKCVEAEDEVGGNIGAGLDWGSSFGELMLNLELFGRLQTLRISLNREARLLLKDWNLGTATSAAVKTARVKLLQRLRLPTPNIRERIQAVLLQDELYGEEFIANREILRELLGVMLTQEDWEAIAAVAADSLKAQILYQVRIEKISA